MLKVNEIEYINNKLVEFSYKDEEMFNWVIIGVESNASMVGIKRISTGELVDVRKFSDEYDLIDFINFYKTDVDTKETFKLTYMSDLMFNDYDVFNEYPALMSEIFSGIASGRLEIGES